MVSYAINESVNITLGSIVNRHNDEVSLFSLRIDYSKIMPFDRFSLMIIIWFIVTANCLPHLFGLCFLLWNIHRQLLAHTPLVCCLIHLTLNEKNIIEIWKNTRIMHIQTMLCSKNCKTFIFIKNNEIYLIIIKYPNTMQIFS